MSISFRDIPFPFTNFGQVATVFFDVLLVLEEHVI